MSVNKLSSYGKKRLGSIYNQYKDNTSFKTSDDFFIYAVNNGYKDWHEVYLEVKDKGLREDNIEFRHAKSRVRMDRMGVTSSNLSYGSKVNIIKELCYEVGELQTKYYELFYTLNLLESSVNGSNLEVLKAYLNNAISNADSILEEIDKIDLK